MLEHIIDILAPHYCVGCKSSGSILCEACSDELTGATSQCYRCHQPTAPSWVCQYCSKNNVVNDVWIADLYDGRLKAAIGALKFHGARRGARDLARVLAMVVPILPETTVVCAVPTAPSRIRQRGYDHAGMLARDFVRLRTLTYTPLLSRRTSSRQVGADRRRRLAQAREAFDIKETAPIPESVLIIDDVITTGATVEAAARCLKKAGVKTVYVAAVAFEPLKK